MGRINKQQWVLSIVRDSFRIPFRSTTPLSSVLISRNQSSSPLLREEISQLLQKRAVERVQDPGTPSFYSWLFLVPKKNGKLCPVIDLSLLNQYIRKLPFKLERVKSVRQSILVNDWTVSTDLTNAYLHVPVHPRSRKYLRFMFEDQVFQFTDFPFRMSSSLWILTKLMDVIAAHLCQRAISLFPYLDHWLIRDLICNQLVSHTKYCLQTVQSLGFIPNLKKSDLISAQTFTFIGMGFLTEQNIVRVPADRVDSLFLTTKVFLSQTQVSARTFLYLLGKVSAAAEFILLGRFHLQPLQMCLICLETSNSSSRSSGSDQQHDSIPFEMVDGHQSLCSGNIHSSSRSQCIPFYGCQSLWMGSSSRANKTILSWSLIRRPITAPYQYQYSGNDGHSFSTKESHKIQTLRLCYDLYQQYNSGLLLC